MSIVNKFLVSRGKTVTKFLVILFAASLCSVIVITLADDSTAAPPISFTDNGIIYTVTSEDAFDTFDGTVKVGINGGTVGPVTIPSEVTNDLDLKTYSVTSIGDSSFHSCSSLTSVDIPDSVTSIGHSSFYSCSALRSVILTDSVISIGGYAFANCYSLTSFTIPNSVTSVDRGVFATCKNLASVIIPEGVVSISDYAFFDCSGLSYIIIPASVTCIGEEAFSGFKFYRDNNKTDLIETNDAESLAGHTYSGSYWQDLVRDVTHTVSFKSGEETIHSYQLIFRSTIVLPDEIITKESTDQYDYTFFEWAGYEEGMVVTGDVTFNALFTDVLRSYAITWMIEGIETTTEVAYGTVPEFDGTPTKAETDQYTYTFSKWVDESDKELVAVTGPTTYASVFNEIPKPQDGTSVDNNTMLYIGISVMIIVIISLVAVVVLRSKKII